MKGERQMIYKNITFKADPFSYDLEFDDRITLVGGDSGSGKTVLYEMLEDIRLIDEYKAIKLFNYKSDDFLEAIKQCRDSFIVIDNADCLINDDVRRCRSCRNHTAHPGRERVQGLLGADVRL